MKETVVLLHGLARTHRSMRAIEKFLTKAGYQVLNLRYPSRKATIPELAAYVYKRIQQSPFKNTQLHFVGFSMGCLLIRVLLSGPYAWHSIGKVVMIGPPNHGSEVADFLQNNFLYKAFYGPAGQQVTTAFAKKSPFPKVDYPLGIIAGNQCLDPLSYLILPKGHDGKVTLASTQLEGMKDHIILPSSHTFIMKHKQTCVQVEHFLKQGHFSKNRDK